MTTLIAPAKLTVSLRITGVREEGLHSIDAEMVSLDLCDELRIGPGSGVSYIGSHAGGLAGDDGLVGRALRLAGREAHVEVTKNIPAGAGLGGGSSDAAAVLAWAGFRDEVAATTIGADVAFCLRGGRARVSGIGEIIEPLPFVARHYTLLLAPFGCATPSVYRAWDDLGGPAGDNGNDLEAAACAIEPRLERYREILAELSGQTPRLAGSGSTWFVEGSFETDRTLVCRTVPGREESESGVPGGS